MTVNGGREQEQSLTKCSNSFRNAAAAICPRSAQEYILEEEAMLESGGRGRQGRRRGTEEDDETASHSGMESPHRFHSQAQGP